MIMYFICELPFAEGAFESLGAPLTRYVEAGAANRTSVLDGWSRLLAPRPQVHALSLRPHDDQDLHRRHLPVWSLGRSHPVRLPAAELGRFPGTEHEPLAAQDQQQPALQDVEPFAPLVAAQAR